MWSMLRFALSVVLSFILGCFWVLFFLESNNNQTINIYGTYVSDFSTLSVNHNLTYHYSYPFSNGRILKIDNNIYIFNDGEFNGYIAFFLW